MKGYQDYMDRQHLSTEAREKLLALKDKTPAKRRSRWTGLGIAAACLALIAGLAITHEGDRWKAIVMGFDSHPDVQSSVTAPQISYDAAISGPDLAAGPAVQPSSPTWNDYNFRADSGGNDGPAACVNIPPVQYPDLSQEPYLSADSALAFGSFSVGLTQGDISRLLGQEGQQGNVPWLLGWDGYTISGRADYSPEGELVEVTIWGIGEAGTSAPKEHFTLRMAPGHLPPSCVLLDGAAVTEVEGVEITAWSRDYDRYRNGTLVREYECTFLAHDVGIRFAVTAEDSADLDAGYYLNARLVNWCTLPSCPLTLEHLRNNENIPAWRSETFESYAALLEEADFAPYLPEKGPAGFGEFQGRLSYQEGNCSTLSASWRRGYDNVRITVSLPEGEPAQAEPIDIARPETYDVRLYPIPWCDSVPEELISYFLSPPTFRAQDMSLEIVKARMTEHDTGGEQCGFKVLHQNGVLVSYSCSGLTAEQVWALIEPTL